MTFKEELEILRGEQIKVFVGDPKTIPCIETSDPEKLCRHPVVSVHMITYNHEQYIRQAIEGVIMQKTDFEYELVIGEDCSQDKTREICFQYQKKYPDKIRVLWWRENVTKLGGNWNRVAAHCRGEFIAFCEGDDYWIDSLKLQKQVDVMRKLPKVGLCYCDARLIVGKDGRPTKWHGAAIPEGIIPGHLFLRNLCAGVGKGRKPREELLVFTATTMIRVSSYLCAINDLEISKWVLPIADTTTWAMLASISDVYHIDAVSSVYRIHSGGICSYNHLGVMLAGAIVKLYFLITILGLPHDEAYACVSPMYFQAFTRVASKERGRRQISMAHKFFSSRLRRRLWGVGRRLPIAILLSLGLMRGRILHYWNRCGARFYNICNF